MRIAPVAEVKAQFSAFIRASEKSPVIVTRNGKPVAVLLGMTDGDEIERLLLAHSERLGAALDAAEHRILTTGGMTHEDVWNQVDAAYDSGVRDGQTPPERAAKPKRKRVSNVKQAES